MARGSKSVAGPDGLRAVHVHKSYFKDRERARALASVISPRVNGASETADDWIFTTRDRQEFHPRTFRTEEHGQFALVIGQRRPTPYRGKKNGDSAS